MRRWMVARYVPGVANTPREDALRMNVTGNIRQWHEYLARKRERRSRRLDPNQQVSAITMTVRSSDRCYTWSRLRSDFGDSRNCAVTRASCPAQFTHTLPRPIEVSLTSWRRIALSEPVYGPPNPFI